MPQDTDTKSGTSVNKKASTLSRKRRQNKSSTKRAIKTETTFDPNINFDDYLLRFRADFNRKWNNVSTPLSRGLKGFRIVGTLGTGSFGNVKLVEKNTTGRLYAVKVLTKKMISEQDLKIILNEKRVLRSIRFPFHTNLKFSRQDDNNLYLGMSLAGGGELFAYHRKLGHFNENQACFYAAQIFLALEYLHCLHLIYRDLKPENICLDTNGYIKITDYGFTKYVLDCTSTVCGTPEYLAPEIINLRPYNASVDWWAFGVLLYEFVAGKSPFGHNAGEPMKMYEKIRKAEYRMLKKFSPLLRDLISRLLQPELSKRIGVCKNGVKDIKGHNWFKNTNWYALLNHEIPAPYVPLPKALMDLAKNKETSCHNILEKNINSDPFDLF